MEKDRTWREDSSTNNFAAGFVAGMGAGTVGVSAQLLTSYAKLGLNEQEVMFIMHILVFKEKEQNDFPTPEEIEARMSIPYDQVIQVLSKLVKGQWISIDKQIDPVSGIQYERYELRPMYEKLAHYLQEHPQEWLTAVTPDAQVETEMTGTARSATDDEAFPARRADTEAAAASSVRVTGEKDIYRIFEVEFSRPLSPMEAEMITNWETADQYPRELILLALKEAVFAGKLNFRYIDRILLEWQRHRIKTVEQAKEHAKNFRAR